MRHTEHSPASPDDSAVHLLRKCGHYLHHSAGKDQGKNHEELLAVLSDEEKRALADILQKCLDSWQR